MEQEEIDVDDYPSWLGNDLINDRLPWEKGLQISFAKFGQKYTIHDSCWTRICPDSSGRVSIF